MKLRITVLILIFLFCEELFSQKIITIDEAIKIGIKNNSELKQAQLDIDKANAQVSEVFGVALPSIDLNANYSHAFKMQIVPIDFQAMLNNVVYGILFQDSVLPYDKSKFLTGNNFMSMMQPNNFQAQLQLTQILFNSAVFTGIGVSKDYLNISKAQYNSKLCDVIMNIKNAFYGVLYTKELLEIINVSYKNAQDNLANVTALSREGLVSEFTLLDATVRVENIKPQIKQLENIVLNATDGLKLLLNIPLREQIIVDGKIIYQEENFDNIEKFITKAKENNLNIQMLEKAININNALIEVSESDYYPTLAGFANYGINGMSDKLFSNFTTYPTSMIGISLSINLFKGMQTKYKVQQSKLDLIKTEEQITTVKDAIEMQVKVNINELNRIKEDIKAQERNVNVAERVYQLSTIRFKEGTGNQLEILNSDVALKQAKTNLLESVYNYTISKVKLDNLLGSVSSDWMK